MLLILLSEIDPYTLKVGDLSRDLGVLSLSRYHYYIIYSTIMLRNNIYNGYLCFIYKAIGNIVVYLLYTTSFVMFEEVKISYSYLTAGWVIEHQWRVFPDC